MGLRVRLVRSVEMIDVFTMRHVALCVCRCRYRYVSTINCSVLYELSAVYTITKLSVPGIQDSINVLMNCGKFYLIYLHAKANANNITTD